MTSADDDHVIRQSEAHIGHGGGEQTRVADE
jgi:hypothetical protein